MKESVDLEIKLQNKEIIQRNFYKKSKSLKKKMFEIDNDRQRLDSGSKQIEIYLIQNGSPDRILRYQYKRPLNKQDVMRVCQKNWQTKYKNIRFFAIDGVQYQDEDLTFIKNKQRFYISRGQQFDYESNFGEYKTLKPLGEGGFGKVMLAQNIITKQLAAVKIIKVQKIYGASDIDMIFRQIQNLKALNHPNIVKIINCYMLKNMQVYVVMEYLQGGQLLKLLTQRKTIPEEQAKHYFRQIVNAVCYCHRQNIIHRDLKVENILFKSHEQKFIKIADFGISGVADQFNPDFDAGTLKYMAPQVLSAKQKSNSPSVDVWACGVILYYMVFGTLPFHGTSTSHIIHAICQGKYSFPKQPNVSQECKNLIQNILQINPKKRMKMDEIRDDPWLTNSNFNLNKKLSITNEINHILEENLGQQKNKSKVNKLKQIVGDFHKINEIQNKKNNKRDERKSLHLQKIQRKNTLGPIINIPKRLQKQKDKIIEELKSYGQRNHNHYINDRQGERRQILFKGNSMQIGVRLSGGLNGLNSLNSSNYCSQQLPSLKDPIPLKQSRGNQRLINSSSNKRQQKSKQPKDHRMKKKSSIIHGWK